MPVNVEQLRAAKADIEKLLAETSCAPILVRLAWHDAGTYDHGIGKDNWPKCGGANGSIRFAPEITHGANNGLSNALAILEDIKAKYDQVGYADLLQLASATAIKFCGGPDIPMKYGRMDATGPDMCHPEGNLPAGEGPYPTGGDCAGHLRCVFHRMGLTDQDIVALSGAHTLGRVHTNRSGLNKKDVTKYTAKEACPFGTRTVGGMSWTKDWVKWSNDYFQTVQDPKDDDLIVLETDAVLFKDEKFKPFAEKYAKDLEAFNADYAVAHAKLSELGVKWVEGAPVTI